LGVSLAEWTEDPAVDHLGVLDQEASSSQERATNGLPASADVD